MWRTTTGARIILQMCRISIHVPHVEDDEIGEIVGNGTVTHFNPRPPCGGRLEYDDDEIYNLAISIHVPHVEDDHGSANYTTNV